MPRRRFFWCDGDARSAVSPSRTATESASKPPAPDYTRRNTGHPAGWRGTQIPQARVTRTRRRDDGYVERRSRVSPRRTDCWSVRRADEWPRVAKGRQQAGHSGEGANTRSRTDKPLGGWSSQTPTSGLRCPSGPGGRRQNRRATERCGSSDRGSGAGPGKGARGIIREVLRRQNVLAAHQRVVRNDGLPRRAALQRFWHGARRPATRSNARRRKRSVAGPRLR